MRRTHFQIIFYIVLTSLIISIGLMSYETYAYRKSKEWALNITKTAAYAAEIKYKNIQNDSGDIQNVFEEYYNVLELEVQKERDELFPNFPIFITIAENGYYVYEYGKLIPDDKGNELRSYDNGQKLSDLTSSEISSKMYNEINNSVFKINKRYSIDIPWILPDNNVIIPPSPSILAIYVSPYHLFNNESYTNIYQIGGQIRRGQ